MDSLQKNIQTFYESSRLSKATIRIYVSKLNNFASYLSTHMNVEIQEIYLDKVYLLKDSSGIAIRYLPIDSDLIDNYFKLLIPKGFYPMRDHYSALSSFFLFLDKNYNFKNPMIGIEFRLADYTPEKKYSRVLTRGNIIKFLNSIITHSKDLETDLLLFSILLTTGCRISEILGLQCKNIDIENESFLLEDTKNKHQRIVNLRPGMGEIINRYTTKRDRMKTDYLFLNNKKKKFSIFNVNKLLKNYLLIAGLPPINIHAFRHTFATLMADEGTSISIIQQLLGHKRIESTKGYINPHYVRNKTLKLPENQQVLDGLRERLRIKKFE